MDNKKTNQRIKFLNGRILTLEWDKKHKMINFSKENILKKYREELTELESGQGDTVAV